jgi:hypothetical protein
MEMQLKDLHGIGKKMTEDFEQPGIRSVDGRGYVRTIKPGQWLSDTSPRQDRDNPNE